LCFYKPKKRNADAAYHPRKRVSKNYRRTYRNFGNAARCFYKVSTATAIRCSATCATPVAAAKGTQTRPLPAPEKQVYLR
jgi:hypothetical protein